MFRENKKYQLSLFRMVYQLPLSVKKMLDESWALAFWRLVFDKIDERRYSVLYSNKEISTSSLQNPADDTTTFTWEGYEDHQGYVFNVAETCSPVNPVQILTDVSLYPNVVSDEVIAAERVPEIKERMDITEMITDVGFTGDVSEKVCDTEGVALISIEVKGRQLSEDELFVAERQKFYSLYFTDRKVTVTRRRQALDEEGYREKCRLRLAVEGVVSQFKQRTRNGKLKVRGYQRARNVIITMAIGINFGRIWAYLEQKKRDMTRSLIPNICLVSGLGSNFHREMSP